MNNDKIANSKYLVYSLDNHIGLGEVSGGELPEVQTLSDILMWLSDDIDKETLETIPKLKPGETYIFREGQHGNFESREIHFIKLKD